MKRLNTSNCAIFESAALMHDVAACHRKLTNLPSAPGGLLFVF